MNSPSLLSIQITALFGWMWTWGHYSCMLAMLLIEGVEGLKTKQYSDTSSLLFGEFIIWCPPGPFIIQGRTNCKLVQKCGSWRWSWKLQYSCTACVIALFLLHAAHNRQMFMEQSSEEKVGLECCLFLAQWCLDSVLDNDVNYIYLLVYWLV